MWVYYREWKCVLLQQVNHLRASNKLCFECLFAIWDFDHAQTLSFDEAISYARYEFRYFICDCPLKRQLRLDKSHSTPFGEMHSICQMMNRMKVEWKQNILSIGFFLFPSRQTFYAVLSFLSNKNDWLWLMGVIK